MNKGITEQGKFLFVSEDELRKIVANAISEERQRIQKENDEAKEIACLSRADVAKMLSVNVNTLWRWARDGYLSPKRVGRRVLYLKSDVERIINKG